MFGYLSGEFLKEYEHEILFFGVEDLSTEYQALCSKRGIKYRFVKKTGLYFSLQLTSAIKASKAKIIFCHSLPLIPILSLMNRKARFKYVLIEHASIALKRPVDFIWSRLAVKHADRIVYLTEKAKAEAEQRFRFKKAKACVIANGVDTALFLPAEQAHEGLRIISHGRFVAVKNLELLLQAVALLGKDGFDVKCELVGDGEALANLKDEAVRLAIESKVEFTGFLDQEKLVKRLQASDIYVNCSRIESMSTALMQAMSCALSCVVSDIDGNKSMIEHEKTGLLFASENVKDLVSNLKRLIQNDEMRRQLAENARVFAKKNYSVALMQSKYANLANELSA